VRMPQFAIRSVAVIAVPLLMIGAVAGIAPAVPAAVARAGPAVPTASSVISGQLNGVAATSLRNAWAVGCSTSYFTGSPKARYVGWYRRVGLIMYEPLRQARVVETVLPQRRSPMLPTEDLFVCVYVLIHDLAKKYRAEEVPHLTLQDGQALLISGASATIV
jgi:hypothetical protein